MERTYFDRLLESRWLYHIFFWLVLIILLTIGTIASSQDPETGEAMGTLVALRNVVIELAVHAVAVYVNLLILIPRFLQRRKYLQYILLLIALVAFITPIHATEEYFVEYRHILKEDDTAQLLGARFFVLSAINVMLMVGLTTVLKFAREWFTHQREKQELERQKLQAELNFLKSQINPHFLFNTLNNVYSLTLKKSDTAPEVVLKLSDMMRYMLYESNEKQVPLEKEINYIKNYIDLEKLRQGKSVDIDVQVHGDVQGKYIAPLLFIPFLENSFKHGVNRNIAHSWVRIDLGVEGHRLVFTVENNKPADKAPASKSGGIGLKNVKRRLALVYPDKHHLDIQEGETTYKTRLTIQL